MNFNKNIKDWHLFLLFAIISIISTIIIRTWFHDTREVANLGIFFFKLIPFFSTLLAIAFLPPQWFKQPWNILLIFLSFAIILSYFIAKLFFYDWNPDQTKNYLLIQLFTPYIILCLTFAFKIGGGKKKETLVLGTISIIFMISGIEDLAYQVNDIFEKNPHVDSIIKALPEKWDWASHMTIFLGRVLNKYEALIFIGIHFVIIIIILYFAYFHKNVISLIKNGKKLDQKKSKENDLAGKYKN